MERRFRCYRDRTSKTMSQESALQELHSALGYKKLNRWWAKLEIVLGLSAAGCGLLMHPTEALTFVSALVLFVLGGYLAMAGHRSHLYQSSNERVAYLAELIRSDKTRS
jgi:uncharacterized membrane protein YhhN